MRSTVWMSFVSARILRPFSNARLRIPMMPDGDSDMKPDGYSNFIPDGVPI
jgi:hypothetical protein